MNQHCVPVLLCVLILVFSNVCTTFCVISEHVVYLLSHSAAYKGNGGADYNRNQLKLTMDDEPETQLELITLRKAASN